jgi:hypothetical protein
LIRLNAVLNCLTPADTRSGIRRDSLGTLTPTKNP